MRIFRLAASTTSSTITWMVVLLCWFFLSATITTNHHSSFLLVSAAHSRRRRIVRHQSSTRDNLYDRSVTTLDPTGRLRQVEYAQAAAARGGTVAAVRLDDAIYVLVVTTGRTTAASSSSPSSSSTSTSSSHNKVHRIVSTQPPHQQLLWMVTTGLAGDARTLVHRLRRHAAQWMERTGGSNMRVAQAAAWTAQWMHRLTCQAGRRPLGVTALVLGMDEKMRGCRCNGWEVRTGAVVAAVRDSFAAVPVA